MPHPTPSRWPPPAGNRFTPWLPALVWVAVLYALSAQSTLPSPGRFGINDKVAHFLAFGVLGLALGHARYRSPRGLLPHWLIIAAGVVYGALDEFHQAFVPNRHPSLGDFVADGLGVIVGYGATILLVRAVRAAADRRARRGGRR